MLAPAISFAALDPDTLLKSLARPAPAVTPFVEVRYSKLLEQPIVVKGQLEYHEDGTLVRAVKDPFQERTEIKGETVNIARVGKSPRRFSLKRAPELRSMLGGFAAVLGGGRADLERDFNIGVSGVPGQRSDHECADEQQRDHASELRQQHTPGRYRRRRGNGVWPALRETRVRFVRRQPRIRYPQRVQHSGRGHRVPGLRRWRLSRPGSDQHHGGKPQVKCHATVTGFHVRSGRGRTRLRNYAHASEKFPPVGMSRGSATQNVSPTSWRAACTRNQHARRDPIRHPDHSRWPP